MRRCWYSEEYYADLGEHVFPMQKYRELKKLMVKRKLLEKDGFAVPPAVSDEDVLSVHTAEYVRKLKEGSLTSRELRLLEVPFSKQLVAASWRSAGGTLAACRDALEFGLGVNLCGGFHHAFTDHGEGFCVINDVAIAIRRVLDSSKAERAVVIDCDLHQGNGTAAIFAREDRVFTFSIHQEDNYPFMKPASNLDIGLSDGTGDEEYIEQLTMALPRILKTFRPQVGVYVAGADPYHADRLGGLKLTKSGLRQRDILVRDFCKQWNVGLAVVLGGGYAAKLSDTVDIHYNTMEVFLGRG